MAIFVHDKSSSLTLDRNSKSHTSRPDNCGAVIAGNGPGAGAAADVHSYVAERAAVTRPERVPIDRLFFTCDVIRVGVIRPALTSEVRARSGAALLVRTGPLVTTPGGGAWHGAQLFPFLPVIARLNLLIALIFKDSMKGTREAPA